MLRCIGSLSLKPGPGYVPLTLGSACNGDKSRVRDMKHVRDWASKDELVLLLRQRELNSRKETSLKRFRENRFEIVD